MSESINRKNFKGIENLGTLNEAKIKELTKEYSNNHITNYLFDLMRNYLENYKGKQTEITLINLIEYTKEVLDVNPSINRKSISKKLKKIYEKIDEMLKSKNLPKEYYKDLNKLTKKLDDLYEYIENNESKTYTYVEKILETHNIDYCERVVSTTTGIVNIKDKRGVSLFNNICSRYLECVNDIENSKDDLVYYNNLLNILSSKEAFKLSDVEKRNILSKTKDYIKCLNAKDKNYKEKLFYLNSLVTFLETKAITKEALLNDLSKKYNVSVTFSTDLVDNIYLSKSEFDERVELHNHIISLDSPNTKLVDDCISCDKLSNGNYLVGVHIVDILGLTEIDSNYISEALKRVESIYLDKNTRNNLFPDNVLYKASLSQNNKRLANSFFFEMTPEKEIVRMKLLKTVITNQDQTDFKKADSDIRKNLGGDTLDNLRELLGRRLGNNTDNIVSYLSRLVNSQVAIYCFNHDYPILYVQDRLEEEKENKELFTFLKNNRKSFTESDYKALQNSLSSAKPKEFYSLEPELIGYNKRVYATVTSPLRRSVDILNNYVLERCYFDEPSKDDIKLLRKFLHEQSEYINMQKLNIENFTRAFEAHKEKIKIND